MNPIINGIEERVKKALSLSTPETLELQKTRLSICNVCDELLRKPIKVCGKCKCILELKTLVKTEECQLDKW
jgi:hypothetical protein